VPTNKSPCQQEAIDPSPRLYQLAAIPNAKAIANQLVLPTKNIQVIRHVLAIYLKKIRDPITTYFHIYP
jgi:hypothetical protein